LFVDESRPESARTAEAAARAASAPFVNLAARLSPAPGGFILRGQFGEYFLPEDLRPGEHQIRTAALSLLAFEAFRGERLSPADPWYSALREARLPGRAQWVEAEGKLPLLLDGAHNPAGMEALCRHLRALRLGRPRFLFAAMRDKDVASLYRMLRTVTEDVVYLDLGSAFPRALQARELQARLDPDERAGLREAAVAWKDLEPLLRPGGADYAVLCGSLYLLGAVIPLLLPHYRGLEEFGKLLDEERP
jgi:dihydrofolate synthase/folylpolyglutamate synthase